MVDSKTGSSGSGKEPGEGTHHPTRAADFRAYGLFTHRHRPVVPGVRLSFVSGDVRPVHAAMASAARGKNLWIVGGGELAGAFADADLLDELILGVAPVTLGAGAPLLPRRSKRQPTQQNKIASCQSTIRFARKSFQ